MFLHPLSRPYAMLNSLWRIMHQRPRIRYRGGKVNVNLDFLVNNNQQVLRQNNNGRR